jgi:hypothetical protein
VDVGQADVQQNEIGSLVDRALQRFFTRAGPITEKPWPVSVRLTV